MFLLTKRKPFIRSRHPRQFLLTHFISKLVDGQRINELIIVRLVVLIVEPLTVVMPEADSTAKDDEPVDVSEDVVREVERVGTQPFFAFAHSIVDHEDVDQELVGSTADAD